MMDSLCPACHAQFSTEQMIKKPEKPNPKWYQLSGNVRLFCPDCGQGFKPKPNLKQLGTFLIPPFICLFALTPFTGQHIAVFISAILMGALFMIYPPSVTNSEPTNEKLDHKELTSSHPILIKAQRGKYIFGLSTFVVTSIPLLPMLYYGDKKIDMFCIHVIDYNLGQISMHYLFAFILITIFSTLLHALKIGLKTLKYEYSPPLDSVVFYDQYARKITTKLRVSFQCIFIIAMLVVTTIVFYRVATDESLINLFSDKNIKLSEKKCSKITNYP